MDLYKLDTYRYGSLFILLFLRNQNWDTAGYTFDSWWYFIKNTLIDAYNIKFQLTIYFLIWQYLLIQENMSMIFYKKNTLIDTCRIIKFQLTIFFPESTIFINKGKHVTLDKSALSCLCWQFNMYSLLEIKQINSISTHT